MALPRVIIYGALSEDAQTLQGMSDLFEYKLISQPIHEAKIVDAEIVVIFPNSRFTKECITPALRVVICRSTGIDNIECLDLLEQMGIKVMRNEVATVQSVAEYTFGAIMHACFDGYFDNPVQRSEIAAQKVVIVGSGNVATKVTSMLQAIGSEVNMVSARTLVQEDYPEILDQADFICILTSLRSDTKNICDSYFFAAAKEGAIFINAARGGLVVNGDLLAAIQEGRIRKAYLDVIDEDEHATKLLADERVVFTRHTAWFTPEAKKRYQLYLVNSLKKACANL